MSDSRQRLNDGACRFQSRRGLNPSPYFRWKQVVDWSLALLLLFPAIPLFAALFVLVRLTSRGPAIFAQPRVGKNGRNFTMYKIRTMRQDAEALTGPVWSQTRDPRATPVGSVLRTLHLDELPQLWNVLKGEMSLIGPRPERPEFVRVLTEAIPAYPLRMLVRPGITGLAQLNLPPDTDLESVCRKLVLDCEYIERAGLWLDCRILACTLLRIFKLRASWLMRCLALKRTATIATTLAGADGTDGGAFAQAELTPVTILIQSSTVRRSCDGSCRRRVAVEVGHSANGNGTMKSAARARKPVEPANDSAELPIIALCSCQRFDGLHGS